MTSKRMTPLLLAASVFLTGATGAYLGAMTPAHAITSVDELTDVNRNHWAFEALRDLVEKYDVIEGYPDHTFRGNKFPTRWEMAAALNALIKSVGRDLARLGAEKADKTDLETLAKLQEEFRQELNALNARVGALEARATAIEAKNEEQDNRLTLLEKTQIHGDMSFGGFADISPNGVARANASRTGSLIPNDDGALDGISAVGRLRLSLDIPVKEDNEESKVGEGRVYTRLIGAFGRVAPIGASGGADDGSQNPFFGFSNVARDASSFNNEGVFTANNARSVVRGGNVRSAVYVEQVYYKQHFKSGIPLLTDWGVFPDDENWKTSGDLYLGVVPFWKLYDKSPYRGYDAVDQFSNGAFQTTPGIATNYNMPMIAYQWHQGMGKDYSLDLTTSIGSMNVGDFLDGWALNYEGRLNYVTSFMGENYTKPGAIYAGGYNIWFNGNTANTIGLNLGSLNNRAQENLGTLNDPGSRVYDNARSDQGSANALYAGWNQEWYRGIGTTVNYLLADKSYANLIASSLQQGTGVNVARNQSSIYYSPRQTMSAVFHLPVKAFVPGWRDNDVLGIGYAWADFHEDGIGNGRGNGSRGGNRYGDAFEQVLETYYKWQVNDSITIVPSVQFIFNRGGLDRNDVTTVLGLRTNYTF